MLFGHLDGESPAALSLYFNEKEANSPGEFLISTRKENFPPKVLLFFPFLNRLSFSFRFRVSFLRLFCEFTIYSCTRNSWRTGVENMENIFFSQQKYRLTQLATFCLRSRRRCCNFGPCPARNALTRLRVFSRWFGATASTWARYFCIVVSSCGTGKLGRGSSFCKIIIRMRIIKTFEVFEVNAFIGNIFGETQIFLKPQAERFRGFRCVRVLYVSYDLRLYHVWSTR